MSDSYCHQTFWLQLVISISHTKSIRFNSGVIHIIWLLYDMETLVILVTLCKGNPAVSDRITLRWVSYAQFSNCYQLFQTPRSSYDVSVMHHSCIVSSMAIVCFLVCHSYIFTNLEILRYTQWPCTVLATMVLYIILTSQSRTIAK